MALKLPTTLSSGVSAEYWKIHRVEITNAVDISTTVHVGLFLDRNARIANCEPVSLQRYDFPSFVGEPGGSDPIARAYASLKARTEFAGAEDV